MGNAIVITGGEKPPYSTVKHLFCDAGMVIACDGGMDWAQENGILPDIIIGDMDSVSASARKAMKDAGAAHRPLPRKKEISLICGRP